MTHEIKEQPLIEMVNINKYYQMGELSLHILKDVSITIYEKEFVTIMGPSGSGKSTFINVMGFLDNKFDGEYHFAGESVEQRTDKQISSLRNKMVGFVFQDFNLIPSMSVGENIRLPLLYTGLTARKTTQIVKDALESVGLADKYHHKPSELSGGQKQRVAIARALINNPKFIIADEPTGALDTKTSSVIMDILARLNREKGVTIVMVTHEPDLQKYATRRITIVDGKIQSNEVSVPTYDIPAKPLLFDEVMNHADE
ncbi:ABC transporter ATP-binding protein [Tuanshanicoccus lijuaniae]|uniref:ABC transporter ATP-binding protein n=1 Tax=Aerococcaceae bacterium zg-1292 TaxID=2774330 RepID=UPI001935E67E|nr:ABC transporter ATP-binding protein [Aerococcaceae bacterium zg-1292]MBF6977671.1 ABC transporter ATP-binding protein [Aerococcaceae bacterium zg-BR22]MBS4456891.1 ABC transporter ATP-binding protein [Aerococcaceae bacterium zg-A91]MBS4458721.1 ABC transporter ATP-binding protein [Aerococcaceae bacterium zg-BR33]QQA36451.1 ABC transporter ATP-binding protein [Aerococcaceae bacterium zg-1292]